MRDMEVLAAPILCNKIIFDLYKYLRNKIFTPLHDYIFINYYSIKCLYLNNHFKIK